MNVSDKMRILAEEASSGAYLGIAAIITAATGFLGALVSFVRVLRAPTKHKSPPHVEEPPDRTGEPGDD